MFDFAESVMDAEENTLMDDILAAVVDLFQVIVRLVILVTKEVQIKFDDKVSTA